MKKVSISLEKMIHFNIYKSNDYFILQDGRMATKSWTISNSASKEDTKNKTETKGKFLKTSEINLWWNGFLSGLWLETKKEEKIDLDEYFWKKESQEVTAVDLITYTHKKEDNKSKKEEKKSDFKKEGKSWPRNTKATGNIQIEQSTYKGKEKTVNENSRFFEEQRKKNQEQIDNQNAKKKKSENVKKDFPPKNVAENKTEERPSFKKTEKQATTSKTLVKKSELFMDDKITVKEFSEKIGVPVVDIMKKLMENKILTSLNSSLDFDTVSLIAAEFDVEVKKKEVQLDMESFISWDLQKILDLDKEADTLIKRAPVVTVMGHVDHGKTSLLDYLRKTGVAWWEAWWITQSIWASVVEYKGEKITFIDTPWHELFTSLRARGAKLTNIAVIVVAADDSVMPQTIESINHAKAAGVPIIIAITKIDKPWKNLDQIKSDIAAQGLTPEEWGWDTPIIWVSSKTGQGIDELLEQILLQAEILELKYNPNRSAVWVVVDSSMDEKQGVITSMIILTGTLQTGNIVLAYNTYGKIKRMNDRRWKPVQKVTGWEPVQVLGFKELPEAGRIVEVVNNEKEAQNKVATIQAQNASKNAEWAVQEFLSKLKNSNDNKVTLPLILKAEWASSLEALIQAVQSIEMPKNVTIKIIHSDVGQFSDSDVSLAQVSKALLIGFNVSINSLLKKKAEQQGVEIKSFDIIYELTDYLSNLLQGMVEVEQEEVTIWKLEVLGIFYTSAKEMTVWGMVIEWKVKNKVKFRIHRGDEIISSGTILSLQRNKDQVKEVNEGDDCGIKVKVGKKIQEKDILEFYEMQDKKD